MRFQHYSLRCSPAIQQNVPFDWKLDTDLGGAARLLCWDPTPHRKTGTPWPGRLAAMSGWAGSSKRLPWPSPVNTCDRREADHYSLYMFQVGSQQGGDLPTLPALPVSCVTIKWAHHIGYTLKSHTSRLHSRRNSSRALWIAIADLYDHTTAMFSQDNVHRRLWKHVSWSYKDPLPLPWHSYTTLNRSN